MNDISAGHAELPRTAYLTHTLRRSKTAAEQRSHRYVTLEHLLFALLDDPDALSLLEAVGADIAAIRSVITEAVNHRMASLVVPDGRPPSFSYKFDTLMALASEQAILAGRSQVDGAFILVALAQDPESNASVFLVRNGLDPAAAIKHLAGDARSESARVPPHSASSAGGANPRLENPSPAARPRSPGLRTDGDMNDVLASVRELLEAEERKAQTPDPRYPRHQPDQQLPSRRRQEPIFDARVKEARGENIDSGLAAPAPASQPAPAPMEPKLGEDADVPDVIGALRREAEALPRGTYPPPAISAPEIAGKAHEEKSKKRKKGKRRGEQPNPQQGAQFGKLLENIPRKMRVAVPETVEVRISKEESAGLFQGVNGRGQPKTHDIQVTRAMTVRLSAPEGGFLIETLSPETQWVFDRPSFLGDENFGRWTWAIIPNEGGKQRLRILISSRAIDENGLAGDLALPEQTVEVRVRVNYGRLIGQLFKSAFLLIAGGVLTEGAMYVLKMLGKFPH